MQTRHGATASTEPDQKAEETQNSTIAQWMLIASARCRFVSLQGGGLRPVHVGHVSNRPGCTSGNGSMGICL